MAKSKIKTLQDAPYLYMKNQTTGVYHLEGIDPRSRLLVSWHKANRLPYIFIIN